MCWNPYLYSVFVTNSVKKTNLAHLITLKMAKFGPVNNTTAVDNMSPHHEKKVNHWQSYMFTTATSEGGVRMSQKRYITIKSSKQSNPKVFDVHFVGLEAKGLSDLAGDNVGSLLHGETSLGHVRCRVSRWCRNRAQPLRTTGVCWTP